MWRGYSNGETENVREGKKKKKRERIQTIAAAPRDRGGALGAGRAQNVA